MYKVFIVEDHEIFCKGLTALIEEIKDIEVSGTASSGNQFLELIKGVDADVVFMDIKMPGLNGIETTRRAMEVRPELNIVALTMFNEEDYLQQMLEAGAKGFLLKNVNKTDIEKAINAVVTGNLFFSDELMTTLAGKYLGKGGNSADKPVFNEKEIHILNLICEGHTNIEIADILALSHRTVDGYRAKMIEKTATTNTIGLVVYAIKNKLIKL
jgi:DNA-binding NarL/FixJ family response regulator